jgi:hypothetical protein
VQFMLRAVYVVSKKRRDSEVAEADRRRKSKGGEKESVWE